MKKLICFPLVSLLITTPAYAALIVLLATPAYAATLEWTGNPITDDIVSTLVFSAIGIFMACISYKMIDLLTPGNLSKDIAENNIALSILTGSIMLGVCIIIAAVLSS